MRPREVDLTFKPRDWSAKGATFMSILGVLWRFILDLRPSTVQTDRRIHLQLQTLTVTRLPIHCYLETHKCKTIIMQRLPITFVTENGVLRSKVQVWLWLWSLEALSTEQHFYQIARLHDHQFVSYDASRAEYCKAS